MPAPIRPFRAAALFATCLAVAATTRPPSLAAQQRRPPARQPAQERAPAAPAAPSPATRAAARTFALDSTVTSTHEVTIEGKRVPYTAEVGKQPVWDEQGRPIATLFYTYYRRTDVRDSDHRPLLISFNGGPGSASLWMHVAYTGPVKLAIDDEGYPVQPYGVHDNPHSVLDVADIVYVDPVNTGFSRIVGDADRRRFFGVNEDIAYLADWLDTFVSRHGRWSSPKFLIGESYGTTRVSGLARALQDGHYMYLNGVILVSPTNLGIDRGGPVGDALLLPSYAAVAWYHHALAADLQQRDLDALLPEVERYALDTYLPALARGSSLDDETREEVAKEVARYAGLSSKFVLDHNLAVPVGAFRKELLRGRGLTVGRLDARYQGRDRENAGESYDYDPALTAWNHAFAPAANHYLRDVLGWKTDLDYWVFGPVNPWNRQGDRTGEDLRQAMAENPALHLLVQSGYFDTGTPYFDAKYSVWNMDPRGALKDRVQWKGYRSGHMMYLRAEDLVNASRDVRQFILSSIPAEGAPAKTKP